MTRDSNAQVAEHERPIEEQGVAVGFHGDSVGRERRKKNGALSRPRMRA